MEWKDKIETIRKKVKRDDSLWILGDIHGPADEAFLERVKSTFPFVNETYLDFLRVTDGCRLSTLSFFGSGSEAFVPEHVYDKSSMRCSCIFDELRHLNTTLPSWRKVDNISPFVPFMKTITGADYYLILSDGRVLEIDCEYKQAKYDVIRAHNFSEILDEIVLGHRYPSLFTAEPDEYEVGDLTMIEDDDDWAAFLRQQGWL